jgi:hypothetical protein
LKVLVNLCINLSKVLGDVLITLLESLFSELSDLTGSHALLILEEAV